MPAESSAEPQRPVFDVPRAHRVRMVLLGLTPVLHFILVLSVLVLPSMGVGTGFWMWLSPALLAPALLYLLPPLVSRLASRFVPMPDGTFEPSSPEFLRWWFHAQWQVIFNRFPALEEALRMIPGLYSAWLRLWGSRVGSLVYWSSGVLVLDRGCVQVGDRVVLGVGVVLSPHNLAPDHSRRLKLHISTIRIGSDSMLGGQAILAPGTRIGDGELLPAFEHLAPFSQWRDGRRTRRGKPDWSTAAALVTPSTRTSNAEPTP